MYSLATNIQTWIVTAIMSLEGSLAGGLALGAPTGAVAGSETLAPGAGSISATADPTNTRGDALQSALSALQRAHRILEELAENSSHEFATFVGHLEVVLSPYREPRPIERGDLRQIADGVSGAIVELECSVADVRTWLRVARANDPDVRRVPDRFVRRSTSLPRPVPEWSDDERRIWTEDG